MLILFNNIVAHTQPSSYLPELLLLGDHALVPVLSSTRMFRSEIAFVSMKTGRTSATPVDDEKPDGFLLPSAYLR